MQNKIKNYRKPDISRFSKVILQDKQRPSKEDIRNNRNFELYEYPNLEASSHNSEKDTYRMKHLAKDIGFFFQYLPPSECTRMVYVLVWLLKEALRNYGSVTLNTLGRFITYDRINPCYYNVGSGKAYTDVVYKTSRGITFIPSGSLKSLVTPNTSEYAGVTSTFDTKSMWPNMFESFVWDKKHRRLGQLLIQQGFDKNWNSVDYSEAYIRAVTLSEIVDPDLFI